MSQAHYVLSYIRTTDVTRCQWFPSTRLTPKMIREGDPKGWRSYGANHRAGQLWKPLPRRNIVVAKRRRPHGWSTVQKMNTIHCMRQGPFSLGKCQVDYYRSDGRSALEGGISVMVMAEAGAGALWHTHARQPIHKQS
jgi:hypothetical protein